MEILVVSSELKGDGAFEKLAKKRGYGIELVTTGRDALRISKKKSIDVVLLDTSLPDMKGYELIAEIKRKLPQSKVIVIVGHNLNELESAEHNEKIDYYLIKPLDESYLENIINRISNKLNSDSRSPRS